MEGSAWIRYWFLVVLLWLAVSSSKELDKITLSLGLFDYFLKKSVRPKRKFEIKPHATFFIDGAMKSHVDAVTISADCLLPSHSTAPPLLSDVEDHPHTPVHLSHSPNITSLNFCADLVVIPLSSHMHFLLQHPSSHLGVPPDDVVLCSPILDSSLVVR